MRLFDIFRWLGSERVYTLPWLRNRIEYSSDPQRIAAFAKSGFTRSKLTIDLLTQFHLSKDSIVVSDDDHAHFLRKLFAPHLPTAEKFPGIARDLVQAIFARRDGSDGESTIHLSSELIREVYTSLLSNILGVTLLRPLMDYIKEVNFQPGLRPLHLEGLMYAFGLHLPAFLPVRALTDWWFYKTDRRTRQIARRLEQMVVDFSVPREGSWYSTLLELKASGKITRAQFRGELTSIFVSSFSVSAAISSMLLCLAARREYFAKIHDDHKLAKCFVNEVLRLYPPFRQFGYERKGMWGKPEPSGATDFMVAVFALHRNQSAWKNPELFYPERFLEPGSLGGAKFLPFGMGTRGCPGRSYSLRLMVEILNYVCSDHFAVWFGLPMDYRGDTRGMPIGAAGRLISFPIDDRLTYRRPMSEEGSRAS